MLQNGESENKENRHLWSRYCARIYALYCLSHLIPQSIPQGTKQYFHFIDGEKGSEKLRGKKLKRKEHQQ